jgi:hypothetical protein
MKWKNTFTPNKIAEPAITWERVSCDCGPKEFEVAPKAMEQFCIPDFPGELDYVEPYQNISNACSRVEIPEKELPDPFCWDDPKCFDKCDRLEVILDKCERYALCTT